MYKCDRKRESKEAVWEAANQWRGAAIAFVSVQFGHGSLNAKDTLVHVNAPASRPNLFRTRPVLIARDGEKYPSLQLHWSVAGKHPHTG